MSDICCYSKALGHHIVTFNITTGGVFDEKFNRYCYRSGTVNSKSFVGKVLLWIKWKFKLN